MLSHCIILMCCVLGWILSCLCSMLWHILLVGYVKLMQFYLMELHHKVVALSSQVRSKGTYGHVLVLRLQLYIFRVVLAIFVKSLWFFTLFTLFHNLATCCFLTSECDETSICAYFNLFRVLFLLLPCFWGRSNG